MSRAWTVYILMFAVLAGGLWVIFTFGSSIRAPDDISGEWSVRWEPFPPTKVPSDVMRIAQSGRFLTVQLGQSTPISMTLERGWRGRREGRVLQMRLRGEVWALDVTGDIPLNNPMQIPVARVELSGPAKYLGIARRRQPDATADAMPAGPLKKNGPAETANAR